MGQGRCRLEWRSPEYAESFDSGARVAWGPEKGTHDCLRLRAEERRTGA